MAFNGLVVDSFNDKLLGMTKSELEDLFNDDAKIHEMVMNGATVKKLKADKKHLMKSNRDRASENLKLEPQMKQTKEDLIAAHQRFNEALKEYSNYKSKLDEIRGSFSTQTMLALMKVANSEEDEMSEQLQKSLLKKEIDLDEFLSKMLPLRKSFNARRIKIEKLGELELSASGQHPVAASSSVSGGRFGFGGGYPAL
ncbi:unnamed protein product [Mesocestoides corti]|uniref:VPS37 C-terminal domain-containing protein n=1 Tax=Mesocestoides corti TaxID=53468 RepID=A0A0R3UIF7_MESCO|nr:unnamed protein product [Mesocestoides corti]